MGLFFLGFIAMSVQILIIREALAIFNGNELVIGLCLGAWMILTALGAYLGSWIWLPGKKGPGRMHGMYSLVIVLLFLILLSLPFLMPWALVYLKTHLLITGEMAGIGHIGLILLIILTPFCLASGVLFPILASEISRYSGNNRIHKAYALDSAGSILGGILFGLVFFLLPQATSRKPQAENSLFQPSINEMLFPGQEVLETRITPFGKLTITRMAEQYILYENSSPVLMAGDVANREESVHYALLLHEKPENTLMISGGIGGTIDEVFKYPGVRLDYVEIDPYMIPLVDRHVPFTRNDRLRIINKDPKVYLIQNEVKYDVILLNTPDPSSAEANRFYTLEFFRLVKERLNPGGIVSLSIPAAGNYMNDASRMLHSVIYNTLASVFKYVRIIPGNRDFLIASDRDISHSLWKNPANFGIKNLYVNSGYVDEELMNARSQQILHELSPDVRYNSDLRPYVYFQTYRQWLQQFRLDNRIIPAGIILLLLIGFLFLGPLNLGLFTGGFTASSLEFILILWFQVLYGIVYQVTGLIFATFMAGMAAGAYYMPGYFREITFKEFRMLQKAYIILPLIISPLMFFLPTSASLVMKVTIILSFVIVTGFIMGGLFALSGFIRKDTFRASASQAFSADLLGSAIGILLVAVYLVPVIGLPMTCLVLAGLNVAALTRTAWSKARLPDN